MLPYLARYGVDPEDVTLVLYGGAGALHGPLLAQEIGLPQILVSTLPSVFCTFGGLRITSDGMFVNFTGTDPQIPAV